MHVANVHHGIRQREYPSMRSSKPFSPPSASHTELFLFILGRKKSADVRSELYGGWGSFVTLFLASNSKTMGKVWLDAFSWCKIQLLCRLSSFEDLTLKCGEWLFWVFYNPLRSSERLIVCPCPKPDVSFTPTRLLVISTGIPSGHHLSHIEDLPRTLCQIEVWICFTTPSPQAF
ncbi:hypothetical protein TNCV_3993831 [Trichonephila clavipes]|uniref:Uncharacterized protein n=1 Tax=Trichonephila clavipes TaxID=2585209 RepID=A0A8X6VSS4_TRICX|nr:hypothetical protein TNCV_3993831 [Trichonephila clavipes]